MFTDTLPPVYNGQLPRVDIISSTGWNIYTQTFTLLKFLLCDVSDVTYVEKTEMVRYPFILLQVKVSWSCSLRKQAYSNI